ncbi:MAG: HEAT repeat domain-containing protein [Rhabdochlamydiaceae bacterium]
MFKIISAFLFFKIFLQAASYEDIREKSLCALVCKDYDLAIQTIKQAKLAEEDVFRISNLVGEAYFLGKYDLKFINFYQKLYPKYEGRQEEKSLLENLCWTVLSKSFESSQQNFVLHSLIGAALAHDVNSLSFILRSLKSSNSQERHLAVKISGSFRDDLIQKRLLDLLEKEQTWYVRAEIITSLGKLGVVASKPYIEKIMADKVSSLEEKKACFMALLRLYDILPDKDVLMLLQHEAAGFRELGCQIVAYFNLSAYASKIILLTKDPCLDVRLAAFSCLSMIDIDDHLCEKVKNACDQALSDNQLATACLGFYNLCLLEDEQTVKCFIDWLQKLPLKEKREGAILCSKLGVLGLSERRDWLLSEADPVVQANLALGLIYSQYQVLESCALLFETVFSSSFKWNLIQSSDLSFIFLAPNQVPCNVYNPGWSDMVNQATKVEVLSILMAQGYTPALDKIRSFLKEEAKYSFYASGRLLLEHGAQTDLTIIKSFLVDPDEEVRVQAALLLSSYEPDSVVLNVFYESFFHLKREKQIQVLEQLGQVGNVESFPFLISLLEQPFESIKIAACSALIRLIYR